MPSKAQLNQEMQCTDTIWVAGNSREPQISKVTHKCKRIWCWLYNCVHAYSSKSHWLELSCCTPIVKSTFTFPWCVCVCVHIIMRLTNNLLHLKLFYLPAFIWSANTCVYLCQRRLVSWDCLLPWEAQLCWSAARQLSSCRAASWWIDLNDVCFLEPVPSEQESNIKTLYCLRVDFLRYNVNEECQLSDGFELFELGRKPSSNKIFVLICKKNTFYTWFSWSTS